MSATLSWKNAALTTKTGTTNSAFITDLVSNVNSMSGDSSYPWSVASSDTAGPLYVVLKRKSGAAGRLLFVIWAAAPAGNNAAILGTAPTTNTLYCAWFPSGNVDSPSNLTAASGTILGDDTGAVKCAGGMAIATIYAASLQLCTAACEDGVVIHLGNPATSTSYLTGGGVLVVDKSDVAYDCTMGSTVNIQRFSNQTVAWAWQTLATSILAGSTTAHIRTNYLTTDNLFFQAFLQSGSWGVQQKGTSNDPMEDSSNSKAYFDPVLLVGRTKGSCAALKLRQIAFGPRSEAAYQTYNSTGPALAAINLCVTTGGDSLAGAPWLVNFKV